MVAPLAGPAVEASAAVRPWLPCILFRCRRGNPVAQQSLPVRTLRAVLRLPAEGFSKHQIAGAIGCARSTVQECASLCDGRHWLATGVGTRPPCGSSCTGVKCHRRLAPRRRSLPGCRPRKLQPRIPRHMFERSPIGAATTTQFDPTAAAVASRPCRRWCFPHGCIFDVEQKQGDDRGSRWFGQVTQLENYPSA